MAQPPHRGQLRWLMSNPCRREDSACAWFDTDHGRLLVRADARPGAGEAVVLAARPEAVTLTDQTPTHATPNELTGSVVTHSFLGDSVDHIVRVGGLEVRARCTAATSLPPATTVTLRIDPAGLALIPIGN